MLSFHAPVELRKDGVESIYYEVKPDAGGDGKAPGAVAEGGDNQPENEGAGWGLWIGAAALLGVAATAYVVFSKKGASKRR